jgi:DNA helicase-2/ATP-dependent DNA helicase PcrA
MVAMTKAKPQFVVAGPGAGKTHGMVELIEESLPDLSPYRMLAAVTYTNAAANVIRSRLSKKRTLPKNVFIGTTHSFLNKFVLQPFSVVFEELPSERIYSAVQIKGQPAKRNAILKNLRNRGVVSYDTMLSVAAKLIKKAKVRKRVGNRLQLLFVDEVQDIDNRQRAIFDEIVKAGQSTLYFVGDPEQYISGHTYRNSGQAIPDFKALPFMKLKDSSEVRVETVNRRANGELVDFVNQFRDDIQQQPEKPHRGKPAVRLLRCSCLIEVVKAFRAASEGIELEEDEVSRLYLAKANAAFDDVRQEFGIVHVSNDSRKTPTLLGDASELLAEALGLPVRKALAEYELTKLKWRSMSLQILRRCNQDGFSDKELWEFVKSEFNAKKSGSRSDSVSKQLLSLKAVLAAGSYANGRERSSSIHRAKGLQADAALVLARTENELLSWLETDVTKRHKDKSDSCRLGYVASTRPRELLCFACLKEISSTSASYLESLGIECG